MSETSKPNKTGGLAGGNAGETTICTVGKENPTANVTSDADITG